MVSAAVTNSQLPVPLRTQVGISFSPGFGPRDHPGSTVSTAVGPSPISGSSIRARLVSQTSSILGVGGTSTFGGVGEGGAAAASDVSSVVGALAVHAATTAPSTTCTILAWARVPHLNTARGLPLQDGGGAAEQVVVVPSEWAEPGAMCLAARSRMVAGYGGTSSEALADGVGVR
jgi:hypothetical protein